MENLKMHFFIELIIASINTFSFSEKQDVFAVGTRYDFFVIQLVWPQLHLVIIELQYIHLIILQL